MVVEEVVKRTANEIIRKNMTTAQQNDFITEQYEIHREDLDGMKFNAFMLAVYQIVDK